MRNNYLLCFVLGLFYSANVLFAQHVADKKLISTEMNDPILQKLYEGNTPLAQFKPSQEVIEKRTISTKTFEVGQNEYQTVVAAGAIHYRENGEWKSIAADIIKNETGKNASFPFTNQWNFFKTYYGFSGNGIKMELSDAQIQLWQQAKMSWLDENGTLISSNNIASSVIPSNTKTNQLTYPNVFPYIDATYSQLSAGIKSSYLINDAKALENAPSQAKYLIFSEVYTLPNGWEVKGKRNEHIANTYTSIQILNEKGEEVFQGKMPRYYDMPGVVHPVAENERTTPDGIKGVYRFSQNGNQVTLSILIPTEWVLSKERAFPIVIDPTTTQYPQNSPYWTGASGGNYDGNIQVGFEDGSFGNTVDQGFVQFDISTITDNSAISQTVVCNAEMYLYQNNYTYPNTSGSCSTPSGAFAIGTIATVPPDPSVSFGVIDNAINNMTQCGPVYGWGSAGYNVAYNPWANGWKGPFAVSCATNCYQDIIDSLASDHIAYGIRYQYGHPDPGFLFSCFCICEDDDWINFDGHDDANPPYLVVTWESIPLATTFGNGCDNSPNNDWYVFGYNGADNSLNPANTCLRGYYTASGVGITSTNNWAAAASPSSATNWIGCAVQNDNHTIVYKRKGFPCGQYRLDITSLTGSANLYVNGNFIATVNAATNNIWNDTVSCNTTIEIRQQVGTGNSQLTMNLVPTSVWNVNAGANVAVCNGNSFTLNGAVSGTLPCSPAFSSCAPNYAWTGCGVNPSPYNGASLTIPNLTNNCSYILTVTDGAGCIKSDTVNVTINPIPTATVTSNYNSVCSGQSVNLTLGASTPSTFSWTATASSTCISGFANGSTAGTTLAQTLNNTNCCQPENVTYAVVPISTTGGCIGQPVSKTIGVNPAPAVSATPFQVNVCPGDVVNVNLSTCVPGSTFSWSLGGGSWQSGSNINYTPSASATITAYANANGCVGAPASIPINLSQTPVLSTPQSSYTICSGQNVSIPFSSSLANTNFEYSVNGGAWIPASSPLTTSLSNPSNSTAMTVNFAIRGTTAAGCDGNILNVPVIVNPIPQIVATPAQNPVCSGELISIPVTSTVANTSYTAFYTFMGGPQTTIAVPVAMTLTNSDSIAHPAVFNISATANGCTASAVTSVTVKPTPNPSVVNSTSPLCSGDLAVITLSNYPSGITYTTNLGTVSGNFISVPVFNTTNTTSAVNVVIQSDLNGCSGATLNVPIVVKPRPVITASVNNRICEGGNANISLQSNLPNTTYNWIRNNSINVPGDSTGTTNNGTITLPLGNIANTSQETHFTIVPVSDGCSGEPFLTSIIVDPSPEITLTLSVPGPYCEGQTVTLVANAVPNGNGAIIQGQGALQVGANVWNVTKSGIYCVQITTSENCSAVACTDSLDFNGKPALGVTTRDNKLCLGDATWFDATSGFADYSWQITDPQGGIIYSMADSNMLFFKPTLLGNYQVSLTATTAAGCDVTIAEDVVITVGQDIHASFDVPTVIHVNEDVTFHSLENGGVENYVWYIGDAQVGNEMNLPYNFSQAGDYNVILHVSNASCTDDTLIKITVINWGEPFIPNMFTPNGDGVNETWGIYYADYGNIQLTVFDRWGMTVFDTTRPIQWDGLSNSGSPCASGTYFYVLRGERTNGEKLFQKGWVQVIR